MSLSTPRILYHMKKNLHSLNELNTSIKKLTGLITLLLWLFFVLPLNAASGRTPLPPPTSCGVPVSVTLSNITEEGVNINFVPSDTTVNISYDYEIQPRDSAQGSASLILSGNTGDIDSVFTITGLNAATFYSVYVRAICETNIASEWLEPLDLYTLPTCGSVWYDTGGASESYSNDESNVTTICPGAGSPAGYAAYLTFTSFDVEQGKDVLYIYDGPTTSSFLMYGTSSTSASGFPAGGWMGTDLPRGGLPFISSHNSGCLTFKFLSDSSGTNSGWEAQVDCNYPPACGNLSSLAVHQITGNTAAFNVNPSFFGTPLSYDFELQPQGTAQGTPGALVSGNTVTHILPYTIIGLDGCTAYSLYVRSICSSFSESEWIGPVDFETLPGCGCEGWTDSGGIAGNYSANENMVVTVVPIQPGDAVALTFTSFDVQQNWDVLYVHNGPTVSSPLFNSGEPANNNNWPAGGYSGNQLPYGGQTFISSNPFGAITIEFRSDSIGMNSGWVAEWGCIDPPTCGVPTSLTTTNTTGQTATFNATPSVFGIPVSYNWEVQPLGVAKGTPGGINGTSMNLPITAVGLSGSTEYTIYIVANCGFDDYSGCTWLNFITGPDCATADTVEVLEPVTMNLAGSGAWNMGPAGTMSGPFDTPGLEKMFVFEASIEGSYLIQGAASVGAVDIFIQDDDDPFNCLTEFYWNFIGAYPLNESYSVYLQPGTYYILCDPQNTESIDFNFIIYPPLAVVTGPGTSCSDPLVIECSTEVSNYSIDGILSDTDEVFDGQENCGTINTLSQYWFLYDSQSTGEVIVGTPIEGTDFNTTISVFTGECGNFTCVASNDISEVENYKSYLTFIVSPGSQYYIRVGKLDNQAGSFSFYFTCSGCTDNTACNYNEQAVSDNGGCLYGTACEDCIDPLADNYNPYATIDNGSCIYSGKIMVYCDINTNGAFNTNEPGMPNFGIYFPSLDMTVFTDAQGEIHQILDPGTYSIQLILNSGFLNTTPVNATLIVPASGVKYFGVVPEGNINYSLNVTQNIQSNFHCNNGYYAGACAYYYSVLPLHGYMTMNCDPMFTPENYYSGIAPDSVNSGYAEWIIDPFANSVYAPRFFVDGPGVNYVGQTFDFNFHLVLYGINDEVVYDEEWTLTRTITCGYDPNIIEVDPIGYADPHYVTAGEHLQYKVQFQNTGNAPASDIHIEDFLDPLVYDLSTFAPIVSSHNMNTCLHGDGSVNFIFNNINLPDSSSNEQASHGFLIYNVDLLDNLNHNVVASNYADIYFEENPPITTNTVFNTVFDCNSITGITGPDSFCENDEVEFTAEQDFIETYYWLYNNNLMATSPEVSGNSLAAGDYSIDVILTNPICEETRSIDVTVNEYPQLEAGTDFFVCAGQSIILEAESNGDIVWSNGIANGQTFAPTENETLIATSTSSFGCASMDSISIVIISLPGIEITQSGVQLTAPEGNNWQWYFNNQILPGQTTQVFNATVSGIYYVITTNDNGCSSTSESITIVGVENNTRSLLAIYPNPMDQSAIIQLPEGLFELTLYDATGKLVKNYGKHQNQFIIERSGLPSGKYQLILKDSNQSISAPIILE